MDNKKPKIITIASIKGGVGKSVLTIIFGFILKDFNNKVLLIDMDPQNSLTSYFAKYLKSIEGLNLYYMLKDYKKNDLNKYLNKINEKMYIIPSHPILCKFEQEDERYKEQLLEHCLNKILCSNNFDYVIIDTPPSLSPLLFNALNITDEVIIPIQLERWSVEAFPMLMDAIEEVNIFKNKEIKISIVENQFIKNRNTLKDIEELLYKNYGLFVKGKIHNFNNIKVLINELKEPNIQEIYYKEAKETLKKIIKVC
ncbi:MULTISPECIES: ParA family protein [Borreliella]|uniref:CobQ/CobB/MinD/ParA nucleotide binding domain protein n=3 Tax=Borreliella TaxID=64895 RepID=A0A7U3YBW9_BORBG|nr:MULTISPECIES: ParA family protein [Borreliella]ACM10107.1 CobQ/CobB/MinD/ParA nucleotide binding domain protein [Borreliella burgdorferi 72a]ACN56038.1 CobQ/CobB/MinD/ParA nucleotide binding domain protein [Borreliella burgdorferi CA-11.2A]ACN93182.1 CobQ/CobB/MinD/ParA nucleotide binding domain protein [Borreliella burgdorferi 118a]APS99131.1 chromosome partitioning protein ParA [Borreliella mayonii]APT00251.1 chromosome partitioning protein ParA [Borreliella mayonii]